MIILPPLSFLLLCFGGYFLTGCPGDYVLSLYISVSDCYCYRFPLYILCACPLIIIIDAVVFSIRKGKGFTNKRYIYTLLCIYVAFPPSSVGKESAMQVTQVWFLGWEDHPLEKEMAAHSSTLAWETLWAEVI